MTKPKAKKAKVAGDVTTAFQDTPQSKQSSVTFKGELPSLLHGYGDVANPLDETVAVLDEVVHQQVSQLILMAYDVALKRGSNHIGQEEFLYLLRKNKTKLRRLLNCLHLKALKKAHIKNIDCDSVLEPENEHLKKLNSCKQFLELIDNTGEFMAIFENLGDDVIAHRRTKIAFNSSKAMDDPVYLNFSKCRQFTFAKYMTRFQAWFMPTLESIKPVRPSKFGWELLAYFATEIAAEIVECSVVVKQESEQAKCSFLSISSDQDGADARPDSLMTRSALRPYHLYEVLRRFADQTKAGALFSRPKTTSTNAGLALLDSMNIPVICLL